MVFFNSFFFLEFRILVERELERYLFFIFVYNLWLEIEFVLDLFLVEFMIKSLDRVKLFMFVERICDK